MNKKRVTVIAVVCVFVGALLLVLTGLYFSGFFNKKHDEIEKISKLIAQQNESAHEAGGIINPIDFDALHQINEDIIAWIIVPGKDINYPVLYASDEYYLSRRYDKSYSVEGSIFIESEYNKKSFDDPVTLVYGHQMKNKTMFSNLTGFLSEPLSDESTFMIYTENNLRVYRVFATVQYPRRHILYYNDFSDEQVFDSFFDGIFKARNLASNIDESVDIKQGDIAILSTCFLGNNQTRFLVMGVCVETLPYAV